MRMETCAEVMAGTGEPVAGATALSTMPEVPADAAFSTTPISAPVKFSSMIPTSPEITRLKSAAPARKMSLVSSAFSTPVMFGFGNSRTGAARNCCSLAGRPSLKRTGSESAWNHSISFDVGMTVVSAAKNCCCDGRRPSRKRTGSVKGSNQPNETNGNGSGKAENCCCDGRSHGFVRTAGIDNS
jgi:hypothetical protein